MVRERGERDGFPNLNGPTLRAPSDLSSHHTTSGFSNNHGRSCPSPGGPGTSTPTWTNGTRADAFQPRNMHSV
jgi:hypothetical protein